MDQIIWFNGISILVVSLNLNVVHVYIYIYICVCVCMYVCNARSILKWSLTGLNLEFSFPRLVAKPRLKNTVYPTICPLLDRE